MRVCLCTIPHADARTPDLEALWLRGWAEGGQEQLAGMARKRIFRFVVPLQAGDLEASDSRALAPGTSFESLLLLEVLIDNLKGSAIVCPKGS